jgi:glycine/D-amino acid oxidase-like deaminating enzyme
MRLRLGRSYWLDAFDGETPRLPALRGSHTADVAIVGGGVTGCAAAWLFARDGARVVLVDAARVGRGSTAASTALLMQEPDVDFLDLSRRYGRPVATRIWQSARGAVADLRNALDQLGVRDVEAAPSVYLARDLKAAGRLRRELRARHRAGLPARWLDATQLRRVAGLDGDGAILTPSEALVDPYAACLAFARAARRGGARLFEHSRVRRIVAAKNGVTLRLAHGTVTADRAIVATGYATQEFEPLAARFRMMNTYVIATPRLPAALRRRVGLTRAMVWDMERPYHYLRWTPDGRLLFGGLDRPRVPPAIRPAALRRRAADLSATLSAWYPALEGIAPEYAWEGVFAATPDGLPYVGPHRRYPRQLFALGYGGNGMTLGFFAAQALVRRVRKEPGPDDDLFGFSRRQR